MDVARQAVKLGDQKPSAKLLAQSQRRTQLRTLGDRVSTLTRFDLGERSDDFPLPAVQVLSNGSGLRFEAQATRALLLRADPKVRDELTACHDPPLL